MQAVIGLLLMLLEVCHGVETCDCRKDGSQCYGALGGTVVLQLMDSASEIFRYQLFNNNIKILEGRKNEILSNVIKDRSSFTPSNGTFRINKLNRTDGGEYNLTIFDSNGQKSEERTLKLTIQAPVSSVLLLSECLSQGEMNVSCSSEGGDSPQYSWTLDGHTLTDAQLLSGNNKSNIITLKQDVSGQLVCSVRNNVSNVSKEAKISTCGFIFINCTINGTHISKWVPKANNTLCIEPTTTPTMITDTTAGKKTDTVSFKPPNYITSSNQTVRVPSSDDPWYTSILPIIASVLSALIILLVVGVAIVCAHKKQENNKPKEEEDEQELTYADVRVVQRPGRQKQQKEEVEVEYGQVKISQRPRQTVEPAGDECVYAKVRRGR